MLKPLKKNLKFVLYIYTQKKNVFLIRLGQFFLYPLYTSSAMFSYINGPIELKPQVEFWVFKLNSKHDQHDHTTTAYCYSVQMYNIIVAEREFNRVHKLSEFVINVQLVQLLSLL